ncbi:conjugal transfer protein TraG N-terminal domain-containing protein [Thermodesulfovibrio sp. 3907-1M]|uniref:Conjugal transfer protein TraG N-terminal domain-containing protein n=1 Tax=Thermodesulfovibrio autotrophicus TaxID=3118333 RepID=A0AAU8GZ63_9BACT
MVSKMQRQSLISLIFISLILVPGVVQAATWEYITYGGYDAAVKAWKLVALILSDRNYNGLIISAAVLGAICIFVATYIKIATGAKTGGLSWAVPVLAGLTLYAALVVPKDSLVIYDEKLNRGPYQIDGIPRGIATLAGILNKIEIGMIEIFSTSVDPASDYRLNSGGTGWEVIDYADPVMLSANLRQTLYNYIKDCVFVELARPGTILDADKIASGEQKYDTVISESRNPSLYTVKYDSSNPNGVSATCTEVGNYLIGVMNNPATWEEAFKNACAARGFDVTVPASYNQCKTLIESTLAKTFKDNNSITIPLFGAQRTLGEELQNVIFSSAPSVSISRLATTNTMSQFIGLAVHANSWLPVIKESLMAIAVSAIPLLTLFIVTPLVGRALSIITGLFVWLTLWGVIDAIIHGLGVTLAEDAAAAMSFGGRVDVGLAQVLSYPGYAAKVAATFGGLRWSGLMIASVITAMIIRFGGTALAMLAGSIASLPQGSGQQYGVSAIRNPEGIFKSEILPATTIGGKLWAAGGADNYAKGLKNLDIGTDAGRALAGKALGSDYIAKATEYSARHSMGQSMGGWEKAKALGMTPEQMGKAEVFQGAQFTGTGYVSRKEGSYVLTKDGWRMTDVNMIPVTTALGQRTEAAKSKLYSLMQDAIRTKGLDETYKWFSQHKDMFTEGERGQLEGLFRKGFQIQKGFSGDSGHRGSITGRGSLDVNMGTQVGGGAIPAGKANMGGGLSANTVYTDETYGSSRNFDQVQNEIARIFSDGFSRFQGRESSDATGSEWSKMFSDSTKYSEASKYAQEYRETESLSSSLNVNTMPLIVSAIAQERYGGALSVGFMNSDDAYIKAHKDVIDAIYRGDYGMIKEYVKKVENKTGLKLDVGNFSNTVMQNIETTQEKVEGYPISNAGARRNPVKTKVTYGSKGREVLNNPPKGR